MPLKGCALLQWVPELIQTIAVGHVRRLNCKLQRLTIFSKLSVAVLSISNSVSWCAVSLERWSFGGVFGCLEAEMKVPPAHQSAQAPTGTDSASCFCKKVQIPQFLSNLDKNKLTSVHWQKLGGLERCRLLHLLMDRVSVLLNFVIWGGYILSV